MKRSLKTTVIQISAAPGCHVIYFRWDNKLPFRCFFRQDKKQTQRMSNAADNTATNDPRIITSKALLSLS